MATLRGSTAGAFTSNARTLTLPGGSAAGDIAVLFAYDGYTAPAISNITGWTSETLVTGFGDGLFAWKELTSADITAGSVTVTWNGNYGGYAALSVVDCTLDVVRVIRKSVSTSNGDTGTGRSLATQVYNGDVGMYWAFKRKDGSTPTVSLSRGTSVDASAVANVGGAYRTEAHAADAWLTVSSTVDSGGNVDGLVVILVGDSASTGAVPDDANIYTGSTDPTRSDAWLYKGRATATADSGSGP